MKAFPHTYERMIDGETATCTNTGMDLRDWFAGLAMQGMLANGQFYVSKNTAKHAYYMADLMMEEREIK